MRINDLKKTVYEVFLTKSFDDNIDRLIVSCITYIHIEKIIGLENNNQNSSKQLVEKYSSIFIADFTGYKKNAVAYNIIRETINDFRKSSFLEFSVSQIEKVKKLYDNKTKIIPFSVSKFSQYMYKVAYISHKNYKKLAKIHSEIMIPIIKFYMNNYSTNESDLDILTAEDYSPIPGKVIIFKIKDFTSSRIVNDIITGQIPINIYSVESAKEYVKLINV